MAPVSLPAMSPSQQEGWLVLLVGQAAPAYRCGLPAGPGSQGYALGEAGRITGKIVLMVQRPPDPEPSGQERRRSQGRWRRLAQRVGSLRA
jgi:hypothetical protein